MMRVYPLLAKICLPLLLCSIVFFLTFSHRTGTFLTRNVLSSWRENKIPAAAGPPNNGSSLGLARQISAAELMSRPLARDLGSFPRILHQSWKSLELPAKFKTWSDSCRAKHSDWEWVLWTDADNLELVRKHFSWLEKSYHDLPGEIYRADLVRNLYMYTFGGLYVDLDTECLQSTEVLLNRYHLPIGIQVDQPDQQPEKVALFGRMGNNPGFEHSIPNAWMASTPSHPFFLQPAINVDKYMQNVGFGEGHDFVLPESLTGPVALREAIMDYEVNRVKHGNRLDDGTANVVQTGPFAGRQETPHEVILLPREIIYPYSWGEDGEDVRDVCWVLRARFDPEECKRRLRVEAEGSISITYWSHTHLPTEDNKENIKFITKS